MQPLLCTAPSSAHTCSCLLPALCPQPRLTALPCSEHQLLVAMTHNSTALEDACSGELQLFNTSHLPDTYVAAVLNLSNSTDFVLGDGTRGHGFHNAPLRPGWDYTALLRLEQRSQEVPVAGGCSCLGAAAPGDVVALGGSPLL